MVPRFGPIVSPVSPSFQSPKLVVSSSSPPQVVLPLEQNSTDRPPPTRQIQTSNLSRLNRDLISRGSNFKLGNKVSRATEFRRYTQGVELSINFKRRPPPSPPPPPPLPPRLSKYICNKERERGSVWWPNLRLLVNDTRWQQFTEREYFARTN